MFLPLMVSAPGETVGNITTQAMSRPNTLPLTRVHAVLGSGEA